MSTRIYVPRETAAISVGADDVALDEVSGGRHSGEENARAGISGNQVAGEGVCAEQADAARPEDPLPVDAPRRVAAIG